MAEGAGSRLPEPETLMAQEIWDTHPVILVREEVHGPGDGFIKLAHGDFYSHGLKVGIERTPWHDVDALPLADFVGILNGLNELAGGNTPPLRPLRVASRIIELWEAAKTDEAGGVQ